ncbi:PAP/OAS1 SUBSTRATE-BINDING DOMAIN SUPERFAMILY [Salix viminalis]|uniref:PAP/OAS1 SUBSTRATE-BINDING DOMAIN SUPERFAMILY n=1 Tax=Salix viminalis TaxID=40686 RepID=A0A9Q0TMR5_SALVM|nr:PAP/OAS1 SUBSTRATE-BINDING DOMAIN SUPERFAMILY [Salix viminalis]
MVDQAEDVIIRWNLKVVAILDVSLDQFPLLPSSKKSTSSEIHQSYRNIAEACQAKDCSSTLGNIQFGSFQSSPSLQGLPSSVVNKQAGSGVSLGCQLS